jgi:hypothetical protein
LSIDITASIQINSNQFKSINKTSKHASKKSNHGLFEANWFDPCRSEAKAANLEVEDEVPHEPIFDAMLYLLLGIHQIFHLPLHQGPSSLYR